MSRPIHAFGDGLPPGRWATRRNSRPKGTMPVGHAERRNRVFHAPEIRSDHIGMRNKIINRIAVIEWPTIRRPKQSVVRPRESDLVAEWQEHGPGTLSGLTLRKVRLTLGPTQSAAGAAA